MEKSHTGWVVALAFYSLVAVILTGFYVYKDLNDSNRQTFSMMLEGTAARPYVYRVVMPTTIKVVSAVAEPARPIAEKIVNRVNASGLNSTPWERQYALEYLVCVALTFGCYLGFMLVMRAFIGEFYPAHATFAPILAGLMLLPFMRYTATIYDPMQLLLFPLATLLVFRRQLILFGVVFVLACLNKETAVLLVWLLLIRMWDEWPVRRTLATCAAFGFAWLGIKLGLEHHFRDNHGGTVEWHLLDHNLVLFTHYTVSAIYTVLVLGTVAYMVAIGWRGSNMFLKVGLVGVFVPLFVLSALFGKVDEIRDYYEALPLAFIIGMREFTLEHAVAMRSMIRS